MEIKYVQLYDCLGKGATTQLGKIIEEIEYHDGYWMPTVGSLIRIDDGCLYNVVAVIYNKSTKLVRIKMEKA